MSTSFRSRTAKSPSRASEGRNARLTGWTAAGNFSTLCRAMGGVGTSKADPGASLSPHPARVDRAPGGGRIAPLLTPVAGILAVLAAWALVTGLFKIPDYLLPAPLDVARRLARDWASILAQAEFTLGATLAGFLVSVAIGVPLAFCIVLSRAAERALMPMFVMSQTIPKVAIAPILVVWLGFGMVPKIAIAFLIAFFPIVVSTVTGLKSVELDMLDLVRSMGAGTLKIMLRVRVPTALPHMFAGFKVAICLAVVGAIVGEFVGSDRPRLCAAHGDRLARRDPGVVRLDRAGRHRHRLVRDRGADREGRHPLARLGARR